MLVRLSSIQSLSLAVALLSGCSSSPDDGVTGQGSIRGLHAVAELGSVNFLIEETILGTLSYKDASGISEFDNLDYDFNFDTRLPGDSEDTRLASTAIAVNVETEYTFVLTGTLAQPEIVVWEQFGRDWQQELDDADDNGTEVSVMEVSFGHVDPNLGRVDVFLETPGTSPLSTTPRGTVGFGELLSATELAAGEYQLVYTAENDPNSILFASDPIDIAAATSNLLVVMDAAGITTAEFSVRWIGNGLGIELLDIDVEPALSAVHAAFGTPEVDVIVGDDFSTPLIGSLDYADAITDRPVADGTLNINVTPASDTSVFLAEKEVTIDPGSFNRLYLAGLPGELQLVVLEEDRRTLATHARVQLFQAAARFQTLDVYLVETDVDISLTNPTYSRLLFGTGTSYRSIEAVPHNLVVTEAGTKNVIGGPVEVDLRVAQNYAVIVVDDADITAVDVLIYDQTPR